jgi:hypothetical protein
MFMRHLVRSSAMVATYFDTLPPAQACIAKALQRAVLAAAPDLNQVVKWGNLTFMHEGRNLLAISAHKAHVNLQIFNGAEIASRFPQLDGVGKGMRQIKQRQGQAVDEEGIAHVVQACIALKTLSEH